MTETVYTTSSKTKYILVAMIVVLAFFAAYGVATARSSTAQASTAAISPAACPDPAAYSAGAAEGSGSCGEGDGGCCGGSSEPIEGVAALEGDIQKISVDLSQGFFDPNIIELQAGVPTVIEFGEGSGCMAELLIPEFGVFEDLTNGGAVVELPALDAGEYGFSCGMEMVFGSFVVN